MSFSPPGAVPTLFLSALAAMCAYVAYASESPIPPAVIGTGFGLGLLFGRIVKNGKDKTILQGIDTYVTVPLTTKLKISPNTAIYRFSLPSPSHSLGLPIGQHISVKATIDGKEVQRSYTPITNDEITKGYFELLIKSYAQGNISKYLNDLPVGAQVQIAGPKGRFVYKPNMLRHFGMIAGGTGITPMYQIITHILSNRSTDKTKISLLFANVAEEDILLRDKLDKLAEGSDGQFEIYYVLEKPPADWSMGVGRISKEMIQERLPAPADDIKILMCGPPPMLKALSAACEELGYEKSRALSKMEDQIFKF